MTGATADAIVAPTPGVPPPRAVRAIDRVTRRFTRRTIVPIATVLTLIIGIGDRATGVELPFTILYLLPIVLGTWFGERRLGIAMSVLATACIAFSLVHEGISTLGIVWNMAGSIALFLGASWSVGQLRAHVDHERALRSLAVDQLRHAERLNIIGTLAAGVAHELGTPLNVIAGCAEFLAEDSQGAAVRRRTTMILEQVAKLTAIIRHLLDFGHRGAPIRSRVDLHRTATIASEMLQPTARKRGVTIELEAGEPVVITGNAAELEQVISNLILNAVQATERGTVHVRVGTSERAGHRVAQVEVEDHGCGIPAEDLSRIFDPFFTTKGVGEGTGLGLSVSYGIVRDHEGSIEVVSEPKRGSRFSVVIPLRD